MMNSFGSCFAKWSVCLKRLRAWGAAGVLFWAAGVAGLAQAAPSTEPVPEIPPGAYLEGDILRWEIQVRSAAADNYWSGGVVPFVFANNVTQANRTRMLDAMALWENAANVDFRPWQTGDVNWLLIQNASVNNSFVGPQGGSQVVNINAWNRQFTIAHELGHALGMSHEQSRNDRDTYVTINYGNVSTTACSGGDCSSQFDKDPDTADWLYSPYDFDSVMHYPRAAFTTGGDTITVKDAYNSADIRYASRPVGPEGQCFTDPAPAGGWQDGIGQRTHLSHWDCRVMSFIYAPPSWRFLSRTFIRDDRFRVGWFGLPWETFADSVSGTGSGDTLWIDTGTYTRVNSINKRLTILAPKGTVQIR